MMTTATESIKDRIESLFQAMFQPLCNLYGRWLDEKQFEDPNEYKKVMEDWFNEKAPKDFTFVSASMRPFGITFNVPFQGRQILIRMKVNSTQASWGQVR